MSKLNQPSSSFFGIASQSSARCACLPQTGVCYRSYECLTRTGNDGGLPTSMTRQRHSEHTKNRRPSLLESACFLLIAYFRNALYAKPFPICCGELPGREHKQHPQLPGLGASSARKTFPWDGFQREAGRKAPDGLPSLAGFLRGSAPYRPPPPTNSCFQVYTFGLVSDWDMC